MAGFRSGLSRGDRQECVNKARTDDTTDDRGSSRIQDKHENRSGLNVDECLVKIIN